MSTSRTSRLSKPEGDNPIPLGSLGYLRARTKQQMYNLVLKEFKRTGLTQATLARRLRKTPAQMCRVLGGPGNWTLDTVSDLLFAISGGELKSEVSYPLSKPERNFTRPEWLSEGIPHSEPRRDQENLRVDTQALGLVVAKPAPRKSTFDFSDQLRAR
jgi:hypothetical protein